MAGINVCMNEIRGKNKREASSVKRSDSVSQILDIGGTS